MHAELREAVQPGSDVKHAGARFHMLEELPKPHRVIAVDSFEIPDVVEPLGVIDVFVM
jgi:hypothetical protein